MCVIACFILLNFCFLVTRIGFARNKSVSIMSHFAGDWDKRECDNETIEPNNDDDITTKGKVRI